MTTIFYNESQFYLIIMIMIWFFFIILAEWKRDFVYFILVTVMALPLGVYLLYVSESSILHYFFGTAVILCALYFSYMALVAGIKGRKDND